MAEVREMPERDPDGGLGTALTVRQRRVLEVIRNSVDRRGYPPSLREIGEWVGLTSPSSVAHQLAALERKGYIRRDPNRPRAMEIVSPDTDPQARGYRSGDSRASEILEGVYDETGSGDARPEPSYVPMVGRIGRASCRERVYSNV